jgi:cell division GTPase FtsZ
MSLNDILNNIQTENEEEIQYKNNTPEITSTQLFNDDLGGLEDTIGVTNIKVIGVGGAGTNIVSYLAENKK